MFAVGELEIRRGFVTDFEPFEVNNADVDLAAFPDLALLKFHCSKENSSVSPFWNHGLRGLAPKKTFSLSGIDLCRIGFGAKIEMSNAKVIVGVVAMVIAFSAKAYFVGPPKSLDEMATMADLVVKATAISNVETNIPSFEIIQGFISCETKFRIISIFKGETSTNTIIFQHYAEGNTGMEMFMPQHYEFIPNRSYILFAKRTNATNTFIQLWKYYTAIEDEGVFLAPDNAPLKANSVHEACWKDLLAMEAGTNSDDIIYALHKLDQMSAGNNAFWWFGGLTNFSRIDVIELVRPLLKAQEDKKVLKAAIEVAGSRNPYIWDQPENWLATAGKGHLPGFGALNPNLDNSSARLVWRELTAIADSHVSPDIRALAIRALGRAQISELTPSLYQWAKDSEPPVRGAALTLLSDISTQTSRQLIQQACQDNSPDVRKDAALAIGFGQIFPLLPKLGTLLNDSSPQVREFAAMSLLSFPISENKDLLCRNMDDTEYSCLFVNALALADPASYITNLQEIIVKNSEPTNWWGGLLPAADSWNILFKYVQSLPHWELQNGKFDSSLDALEKLQWFGSSEPRDLYALYVQRGLANRAQAFRKKCRQTFGYDIDYYFNMVDQSPDTYQRD